MKPPPAPARQAATPVKTVEKKSKDIKTLAKALLNTKRWTPRNIDALSNRWRALSAGKQAAARDTTWFLQLKYDLYRRIGKQRARASLGDAEALDRAERLTGLARDLGLDPAG
ncbi:MAG: hypothetical protein GXP17_07375 [Gammaproteobacteria bacterium]|nr:hypothetical protein [Gammaproteobacteria bacterium]